MVTSSAAFGMGGGRMFKYFALSAFANAALASAVGVDVPRPLSPPPAQTLEVQLVAPPVKTTAPPSPEKNSVRPPAKASAPPPPERVAIASPRPVKTVAPTKPEKIAAAPPRPVKAIAPPPPEKTAVRIPAKTLSPHAPERVAVASPRPAKTVARALPEKTANPHPTKAPAPAAPKREALPEPVYVATNRRELGADDVPPSARAAPTSIPDSDSTMAPNPEPSLNPNPNPVFHEPQYRRRVAPPYPRRALELGMQGVVELLVKIMPDGRAGEFKTARTSGHKLLDLAALAAVRHWEFEPPRKNGVPSEGWALVPVRFAISEKGGAKQ